MSFTAHAHSGTFFEITPELSRKTRIEITPEFIATTPFESRDEFCEFFYSPENNAFEELSGFDDVKAYLESKMGTWLTPNVSFYEHLYFSELRSIKVGFGVSNGQVIVFDCEVLSPCENIVSDTLSSLSMYLEFDPDSLFETTLTPMAEALRYSVGSLPFTTHWVEHG